MQLQINICICVMTDLFERKIKIAKIDLVCDRDKTESYAHS